ncbi:MAG: hypothetical protein J7501_09990, partial [Bdellovibrio sp.]|nr:hypothetical protein [Bdellovibrio sp.]
LLAALLKMNPLAKNLQIQKLAAKVNLAKAVASGNPIAITAAETRLLTIQQKQAQLDIRQKQVIVQSNLLLANAHSMGVRELQRSSRELDGYRSLFINSNFIKPGAAPRLAVRPDSTDMAPTYNLEENFEEKQALAHTWQYRLSLQPYWRSFITGNFSFEGSCAVTLKEENSKWIPKIRKAKS